MMIVFLIVAALASLGAAAFFAGTETGFLSVSRERVLHLSREGGAKAQIVQQALSNMSRTTTTLLIGNNLASVAYSSATAALILRTCSGSISSALASFAAAFAVLYFSEFLPKLLCAARPLRRILALAPYYRFAETLLRPLTCIALAFTGLVIRKEDPKYRLTASDLVRILQDRRDGVCLSDFESALISRIVVRRAKGEPITPDSLLSALK